MSEGILSPQDYNKLSAYPRLRKHVDHNKAEYILQAQGLIRLSAIVVEFAELSNGEARASMLATWVCQMDGDLQNLVKERYSIEEICRLISRYIVGQDVQVIKVNQEESSDSKN